VPSVGLRRERGENSLSEASLPVIKVVGVSASGKSTLVTHLRQAGYNARAVSQEHSSVANLWQQFDRTRLLIYLDATLEIQQRRRPDVSWDVNNLQAEQIRLAHARDHADLKIDTSALIPEIIWRIVESFLKQQRIHHAEQPLAPGNATGSALRTAAPIAVTPPPVDGRRKKKRKRGQST
jgi:hypothetical protein